MVLTGATDVRAGGEDLFVQNCAVCHTLDADAPRRQGPVLSGVVGRMAGKVEGFPYSNGLADADWVWSEDRLFAWLEDPQAMVADSYMLFSEADPGIRREIIEFLKTQASE